MSKIREGLLNSRRKFLHFVTGTAVAALPDATDNVKEHERLVTGDHSEPGQPAEAMGELNTRVLSLDGADWLIAMDTHNRVATRNGMRHP